MKNRGILLLLGCCLAGTALWPPALAAAATNQPALNPPAAPQPAPIPPSASALAEAADPVIPEISFYEAPLADVIRFLASEAERDVIIDSALMASGTNQFAVPRPVTLSLTNVTALEALGQIIADQQLVLVQDPATDTFLVTDIPVGIASPGQILVPAPVAPGDETPLAPDEIPEPELDIASMPLLETIDMLVSLARIDVLIDPELLPFPGATNAIATNDLPAMRFYDKTPRQVLEAILENHKLALILDQKTGISRITRRPPPGQEPLFTEVIQLKYSEVGSVVSNLTGMFPPTGRSRITADARTSKVVVVATEREIDAITNLVAHLDVPTKQVLIEAQLLETSRNPRSVKGIDWSGTLQGQNVAFGNGFSSGTFDRQTVTPGESSSVTLPSGRQVTTQPSSSTRTSESVSTTIGSAGLSMDTARGFYPNTAFLNADGVRAVLSFLNTEADTRVLATPRMVLLDNETARLAVTRSYPIFEVTPGAANVPAGAEITYTNVGTILEVTPRIAADSNVSLKITPEVSNIDSVDTQVINGQQNTANVYAIRKMETRVTVPSGSTLVLGGLISDTNTKDYRKVPLLGDIPGIGMLFRRELKERSKANLLVFVTPTIVTPEDFHAHQTEFFNNRPPKTEEEDWGPWDSGAPKVWGKGKKKAGPTN